MAKRPLEEGFQVLNTCESSNNIVIVPTDAFPAKKLKVGAPEAPFQPPLPPEKQNLELNDIPVPPPPLPVAKPEVTTFDKDQMFSLVLKTELLCEKPVENTPIGNEKDVSRKSESEEKISASEAMKTEDQSKTSPSGSCSSDYLKSIGQTYRKPVKINWSLQEKNSTSVKEILEKSEENNKATKPDEKNKDILKNKEVIKDTPTAPYIPQTPNQTPNEIKYTAEKIHLNTNSQHISTHLPILPLPLAGQFIIPNSDRTLSNINHPFPYKIVPLPTPLHLNHQCYCSHPNNNLAPALQTPALEYAPHLHYNISYNPYEAPFCRNDIMLDTTLHENYRMNTHPYNPYNLTDNFASDRSYLDKVDKFLEKVTQDATYDRFDKERSHLRSLSIRRRASVDSRREVSHDYQRTHPEYESDLNDRDEIKRRRYDNIEKSRKNLESRILEKVTQDATYDRLDKERSHLRSLSLRRRASVDSRREVSHDYQRIHSEYESDSNDRDEIKRRRYDNIEKSSKSEEKRNIHKFGSNYHNTPEQLTSEINKNSRSIERQNLDGESDTENNSSSDDFTQYKKKPTVGSKSLLEKSRDNKSETKRNKKNERDNNMKEKYKFQEGIRKQKMPAYEYTKEEDYYKINRTNGIFKNNVEMESKEQRRKSNSSDKNIAPLTHEEDEYKKSKSEMEVKPNGRATKRKCSECTEEEDIKCCNKSPRDMKKLKPFSKIERDTASRTHEDKAHIKSMVKRTRIASPEFAEDEGKYTCNRNADLRETLNKRQNNNRSYTKSGLHNFHRTEENEHKRSSRKQVSERPSVRDTEELNHSKYNNNYDIQTGEKSSSKEKSKETLKDIAQKIKYYNEEIKKLRRYESYGESHEKEPEETRNETPSTSKQLKDSDDTKRLHAPVTIEDNSELQKIDTHFDLRSKLSRQNLNQRMNAFRAENRKISETRDEQENLVITVANDEASKSKESAADAENTSCKAKNKKVKKIQLVIKFLCEESESSEAEEKSAHKATKKSSSLNAEDLSFLDDFNIDEIVSSLKSNQKKFNVIKESTSGYSTNVEGYVISDDDSDASTVHLEEVEFSHKLDNVEQPDVTKTETHKKYDKNLLRDLENNILPFEEQRLQGKTDCKHTETVGKKLGKEVKLISSDKIKQEIGDEKICTLNRYSKKTENIPLETTASIPVDEKELFKRLFTPMLEIKEEPIEILSDDNESANNNLDITKFIANNLDTTKNTAKLIDCQVSANQNTTSNIDKSFSTAIKIITEPENTDDVASPILTNNINTIKSEPMETSYNTGVVTDGSSIMEFSREDNVNIPNTTNEKAKREPEDIKESADVSMDDTQNEISIGSEVTNTTAINNITKDNAKLHEIKTKSGEIKHAEDVASSIHKTLEEKIITKYNAPEMIKSDATPDDNIVKIKTETHNTEINETAIGNQKQTDNRPAPTCQKGNTQYNEHKATSKRNYDNAGNVQTLIEQLESMSEETDVKRAKSKDNPVHLTDSGNTKELNESDVKNTTNTGAAINIELKLASYSEKPLQKDKEAKIEANTVQKISPNASIAETQQKISDKITEQLERMFEEAEVKKTKTKDHTVQVTVCGTNTKELGKSEKTTTKNTGVVFKLESNPKKPLQKDKEVKNKENIKQKVSHSASISETEPKLSDKITQQLESIFEETESKRAKTKDHTVQVTASGTHTKEVNKSEKTTTTNTVVELKLASKPQKPLQKDKEVKNKENIKQKESQNASISETEPKISDKITQQLESIFEETEAKKAKTKDHTVLVTASGTHTKEVNKSEKTSTSNTVVELKLASKPQKPLQKDKEVKYKENIKQKESQNASMSETEPKLSDKITQQLESIFEETEAKKAKTKDHTVLVTASGTHTKEVNKSETSTSNTVVELKLASKPQKPLQKDKEVKNKENIKQKESQNASISETEPNLSDKITQQLESIFEETEAKKAKTKDHTVQVTHTKEVNKSEITTTTNTVVELKLASKPQKPLQKDKKVENEENTTKKLSANASISETRPKHCGKIKQTSNAEKPPVENNQSNSKANGNQSNSSSNKTGNKSRCHSPITASSTSNVDLSSKTAKPALLPTSKSPLLLPTPLKSVKMPLNSPLPKSVNTSSNSNTSPKCSKAANAAKYLGPASKSSIPANGSKPNLLSTPKSQPNSSTTTVLPSHKPSSSDIPKIEDTNTGVTLKPHEQVIVQNLKTRMLEYLKESCDVTALIHRGKFSKIFKCRDAKGNDGIVKTLNFKYRYNKGVPKEQMLMKLQSEIPEKNLNVVRLLNGFSANGHWCFLMEYYPKNLSQALEENKKPFHIDQVQNLSRQLVTAVASLRPHNIVHSDINPRHVLLNATNDRLKLCGFDEAYYGECKPVPNIGTVNYRAPEIILGYSTSSSIDVWSTALVMFEMATKLQLFPGTFNNDILFKQMCTIGLVPPDMIQLSRFGHKHFNADGMFMRRKGDKGQDIFYHSPDKIYKNNMLQGSIRGVQKTWFSNSSKQQRQQDWNKINQFCVLLEQMLVMHPENRLPIESQEDSEEENKEVPATTNAAKGSKRQVFIK